MEEELAELFMLVSLALKETELCATHSAMEVTMEWDPSVGSIARADSRTQV